MTDSFFVYGTLKRGERNASHWPSLPVEVRPAMVRGELFGRADYPAMRRGDDWVLGELWSFHRNDVENVVTALDWLEGTNQPGRTDLYLRSIVPVFDIERRLIGQAYVYFYSSEPRNEGFEKIAADDRGQACWSRNERP